MPSALLPRRHLPWQKRPSDVELLCAWAVQPVIWSPEVGSNSQMAFTIYGATVNIAARLESLGKDIEHHLQMDKAVADAVHRFYAVNCVGRFTLRGYLLDENVYTILPEANV